MNGKVTKLAIATVILVGLGAVLIHGQFRGTYSTSIQDDQDYVTDLNRQLADGISLEENAAADLISLSSETGRSTIFEKICQELGMDPPAEDRIQFESYYDFVEELESSEELFHTEFSDQLEQVLSRPWSEKEFPAWKTWIDRNDAALDLVVQATEKPRYYFPLVADEPELLVACLLPLTQDSRSFARGLVARAMNSLEEGDIEKAIRDIQATRKLGALNYQSLTLVESYVGMAIETMALEAERALISSSKLTPEQARQYFEFLKAFEPDIGMARRIDIGERYMFLDLIQAFDQLGGDGIAEALEIESAEQVFGLWSSSQGNPLPLFDYWSTTVNWDKTIETVNPWYDKIVEALGEENDAKRIEKVKAIGEQISQISDGNSQSVRKVLAITLGSGSRGRYVGNVIAAAILPSVDSVANVEVRAKTQRDLARLAFALELHRLETGEFPEQLGEQIARVFGDLPKDRFNNESLRYKKTPDGFLLYSVGEDGHDNLGRHKDDPIDQMLAYEDRVTATGHDIVVRIEHSK